MARLQGDDSRLKIARAIRNDFVARWLVKRQGKIEGQKHHKQYRKKSYEWLACLHNAICSATTFIGGLVEFLIGPQKMLDMQSCLEWPLLMVACDKGSDGVSALNMLRYELRLNCEAYFDPSHGAWNSAKEAISFAGLSVHQFLMLMAYNVGYGEWGDSSRLEQIKISVRDAVLAMSFGNRALPVWGFWFEVNVEGG